MEIDLLICNGLIIKSRYCGFNDNTCIATQPPDPTTTTQPPKHTSTTELHQTRPVLPSLATTSQPQDQNTPGASPVNPTRSADHGATLTPDTSTTTPPPDLPLTDKQYKVTMDKYKKMRKYYELAQHHLTFNQQCLDEGIFPLGVKANATCATLGADEELKSKYTQTLTKASMELTAANVQHLNRLTTQLDTALTDIEKQLDSQTDTEISSLWKTSQTTTQQNLKTLHDDLKIQRINKMTKTLKAHKLGKVYTNHQTTPRTDQHVSACAKPSSQTRNQSTNSHLLPAPQPPKPPRKSEPAPNKRPQNPPMGPPHPRPTEKRSHPHQAQQHTPKNPATNKPKNPATNKSNQNKRNQYDHAPQAHKYPQKQTQPERTQPIRLMSIVFNTPPPLMSLNFKRRPPLLPTPNAYSPNYKRVSPDQPTPHSSHLPHPF